MSVISSMKRRIWSSEYEDEALSLLDQLTEAVGFHYEYDPLIKQFNHPSGIIILTPDGTISRYLPGIEYTDRGADGQSLDECHGVAPQTRHVGWGSVVANDDGLADAEQAAHRGIGGLEGVLEALGGVVDVVAGAGDVERAGPLDHFLQVGPVHVLHD